MGGLKDEIGRTLDFLRIRKVNFQLAFGVPKIVAGLRRAYMRVFGAPAGQAVLRDLEKFCHANETCFAADPRVHAVWEGRREVWLRIQKHLNLTSEDLFQLYSGRDITSLIQQGDD